MDKPSSLRLSHRVFSFREYTVGETLTYICFDSTLGVDAGPSNKIEYKCKHETPYILGEYDIPKEDGLKSLKAVLPESENKQFVKWLIISVMRY